ncbi:sulfur carrier protein ThiS [Lacinutrix neustonica]|uniref:Sulfur carrier protein ThiS n=1 Tax=Lacinutrix neustonica TaxID=2980107 RepID=A0A9E8MTM4_9FLAO|nr:sulfur carrier protein ThiS [Lacinutrix neustonica]WAC01258.1 sulfur carrier protein ThiS [Lacinutrix neustonica]
MITIGINDSPLNIDSNFTILQVLQQINAPLQGIAVAVNSEIILHAHWETAKLQSGDQVLVIQATQGG